MRFMTFLLVLCAATVTIYYVTAHPDVTSMLIGTWQLLTKGLHQ